MGRPIWRVDKVVCDTFTDLQLRQRRFRYSRGIELAIDTPMRFGEDASLDAPYCGLPTIVAVLQLNKPDVAIKE